MPPLTAALDPLLAFAVVGVASFVALRIYARRAALDEPKQAMGRIRRALAVVLVLTGLAALLGAALTDAIDLTAAAVRSVSPAVAESPVGDVLKWIPTVLGVTAAMVVGYLGVFPAVRELRDLDVTATAAAWHMTRYVLLFFGLMVVVVGTLNVLPQDAMTGTLPMLGFLAAAILAILVLQPWLVALPNETRDPTDDERERIEHACEIADLSPRDVRVLDTDANRVVTAMVLGLPTRRHLFVTSDLLADYDDDVLAAVLTSNTGRAKYLYREYKLGILLVGGAVVLGAITGDLQALTGLGTGQVLLAGLAIVVALMLLGKRLIVASDEYTVERVGAETFVETLEAVADEHQVSYESRRVRDFLLMRPSLGARLDRLWGRMDGEPSNPGSNPED